MICFQSELKVKKLGVENGNQKIMGRRLGKVGGGKIEVPNQNEGGKSIGLWKSPRMQDTGGEEQKGRKSVGFCGKGN